MSVSLTRAPANINTRHESKDPPPAFDSTSEISLRLQIDLVWAILDQHALALFANPILLYVDLIDMCLFVFGWELTVATDG